MTNVSICWCECDSLRSSHKVVRLESAVSHLRTNNKGSSYWLVLLFTWGYIWWGDNNHAWVSSKRFDSSHRVCNSSGRQLSKSNATNFLCIIRSLSSKSQQSSSTRFTTPAAVTVGYWDVSQSGVTHQLCGSHVIFHIQMVCQMRSCQSSDRAHTPPAYKQTH